MKMTYILDASHEELNDLIRLKIIETRNMFAIDFGTSLSMRYIFYYFYSKFDFTFASALNTSLRSIIK